MTFDQFIKTDLTHWGVLLTFALTAFAFAKFFWNHEKELVTENAAKVKSLLEGFHDAQIKPIIVAQLGSAYHAACDVIKTQIVLDLYPHRAGSEKPALIEDKELKEYLTLAAIEKKFGAFKSENLTSVGIEKFSESSEGIKFYEKLDGCYQRATQITELYELAAKACYRLTLTCLGVGILCMFGISQIAYKWPDFALHFWMFATIQLFLMAVWFFGRLESCRRALMRMWKGFEIYGQI